MSEKTDTLISLLSQYGLTDEDIKVYLEIVTGRGDTALKIAKLTKLARTKVYRILDTLIAKKFIITRVGERGMRFVPNPPDQLEFLVSDREYELNKLKKSLPLLQSQLTELSVEPSEASQVRYYHGIDGLKQVTYNSLKAKGELLTYELSTMNAFMDQHEAEKLRARFVENKIKIKTLTNVTEMTAWTSVTEMVEKYWEIRHLDPKDKPFQFEILIYNDIYCMYKYTGNEIFCVEIKNAELAQMQRTLFYCLWDMSKPLKILDEHGTAKLV
jgi:hypothetical protein